VHEQTRILACAFTCCPPGKPGFTGGEDILGWNLLQQIARFHEVWAITNEDDRQSIEIELSEKAIRNLHFIYVGLPKFLHWMLRFQGTHQLYYHLWQVRAYFAARTVHKRIQFSLFHHITYANDWLASFTGALLPIPYVRGPGGGAHRTPKGFTSEYRLGGRLWERVRTLGQWMFRHDPLFIRGQSRASALLLCTNESLLAIPKKWSLKCHLFPVSGISTEDMVQVQSAHRTNLTFTILSAGSLIRVKGFGLAMKAFKTFSDKYPSAEFKIVGAGPEESNLRTLSETLKLESKVLLQNELSRQDLLLEMAAADLFLFPSLRDGGGTVVVEAMAMGTPVICLDAGGPGMHVTDDVGVKVTPHSPDQAVREIAEALERLYLDSELRKELGSAGQEKAKRHYHWDQLGERLMGIYNSILSEKPQNQ